MGNFTGFVKGLAERHPPVAPQRPFLARLAKVFWKESSPTIGVQSSVFWKDVGEKALGTLQRDAGKGNVTGQELLTLMGTHRYSVLTSVAAMFERLTALGGDLEKAKKDPVFMNSFNLYMAYEIAQNELELNLFATYWVTGLFMRVREHFLGGQFADRLNLGELSKAYGKADEEIDNDAVKTMVQQISGRKLVMGAAGSASAAKEFLEALAVTILVGSEAEAGAVGAPAHLWKDRGTKAEKRLEAFLNNPPSQEFVERGDGLPVITQQGLEFILQNLVDGKNPDYQFDLVEALGMQFLALKRLNDLGEAMADPVFLNAFRLYVALRSLQLYTTEFYLTSLNLFGRALIFDTWRIISSRYVNSCLKMSKFIGQVKSHLPRSAAGAAKYYSGHDTIE